MTVVVHSFVADSSQLDCCDLPVFFVFFSLLHLMLAGRQPFWVFEVVSAVLFLSYGVSCSLA